MRTSSAEEFVVAWQTSSTLEEVCRRLDVKPNTARQRAYQYSKLGIPLKKFSRPAGRPNLDVKTLTDLANSSLERNKG